MLKGLMFFIKFSWSKKKSYIINKTFAELLRIAMTMAGMVLPMYVLNEIFMHKRYQWLIFYLVLLLVSQYLCTQATYIIDAKREKAKELIKKEFNLFIMERQMNCDFKLMEDSDFHNLKTRAEQYVNGQWNQFGVVMDKFFGLLGSGLTLIGIVSIIMTLNYLVIIVFLAMISINTIINSYYKNKRQKLISGFAPILRRRGYFEDITKNPSFGKEIRLGNLSKWLMEKYDRYMRNFCLETQKIHRKDIVQKIVFAITSFVQQGVTYIYLVILAISNSLTIGSFTLYLNAVNQFNATLNAIIDDVLEISKFNLYYKDFANYIELTEHKTNEETSNQIIDSAHKTVKFNNVSFKYPGCDEYIIKNINIKLDLHKKYSIVGENGAGKTTFIKLLLGLYEPSDGEILLDGVDIRKYSSVFYRSLFSAVFQDYKLFSFTVKENISLNHSDLADENKINGIIRDIGLDNKIQALKKGIYTEVFKHFDLGGFEPSGGEGQKIVLCRALYKDAPVVILDEPTAALDPRAEDDLYNSFNNISEGKTIFYISHRLASSKICDDILVFKNGNIVERGSHNVLINDETLYKELYTMQLQYYQKS